MSAPSRPLLLLITALLLTVHATVAVAAKPSGQGKRTTTTAATAAEVQTTTSAPALFGYNDNSVVAGDLTNDQAAQYAAQTGATSTGLTIDWSWIEPRRDQYSFGIFDSIYWASLRKGMRPLIGIVGSPIWARGANPVCAEKYCSAPPAREYDAEWQDIIRQLVKRYPGAVGLQIWNEPNLSWTWGGPPDPVRYTELVKLGHAAVKSVDPKMPVVTGGLAPVLTDATLADSIGVRPFLQAMYDNGVRGAIDGIGIHPYPKSVQFDKAYKAIGFAKETRDHNGDDVPLWATEFGISTTGETGVFNEYQQAGAVPALYSALATDTEMRGLYVHTMLDPQDRDPLNIHDGYGLLHPTLQPKPAYCAMAKAAGGSYVCPPDVVQPVVPEAQRAHWEAQTLLQAGADAAREIHRVEGSYLGVTAAKLNAQDPRIAATALTGDALPGQRAVPSKLYVHPVTDGRDGILLCNASRGTKSFCIYTFWRGTRDYGSAAGGIYSAAGATVKKTSTAW